MTSLYAVEPRSAPTNGCSAADPRTIMRACRSSATAINALLVDRLPEQDRGGALTMVWILTLLGFIVGSALAARFFKWE